MYTYTYLNRYGYEQSESYKTLKEALISIARSYEENIKTPLILRGGREVYHQQDILLLCHKYNLI